MDDAIAHGLANKIYERRKTAAYDLERIIKTEADEGKVRAIIEQLCTEFIGDSTRAARSASGGLIGLAAATIALGRASAKYLDLIIPAVLSCFSAQDSRIRYYSTESLYNIAKVAKGEILLYFNEIFDSLCKLAADSENSVKNGSELLDRLVKDIVSEKASSYVSVLQKPQLYTSHGTNNEDQDVVLGSESGRTTAFSLERFVPLLAERLYVINPYTRTFLVSWITVLNSIPDLDLVGFLPEFIDGLMKFLSDTHQDVRIATSRLLDQFLDEIRKPAKKKRNTKRACDSNVVDTSLDAIESKSEVGDEDDDEEIGDDDDGISVISPFVDFPRLILVLHPHLSSSEEAIQLTAMRWFSGFFTICPQALLPFTPRLLRVVLPAIAHESITLRRAAKDVNDQLLQLIRVVIDGNVSRLTKDLTEIETELSIDELDFASTVQSATLQLSNENEETRSSALGWLMELHRLTSTKADPGTVGEPNFRVRVTAEILPPLLKALSDTSETVVKKNLTLLAQISRNDDYFSQLMIDLLSLFASDRRLLETRGSLIIRQLSLNLNAERIYRTLAENLEKEPDLEFVQLMIQHLNSNLLTAPELFDARRRLRQIHTVEGSTFFVSLYKPWCYNAVATFSLCLLAQAYEQASNLLQIFGDLEITVQILVQIDKLVQLLESPVFTYLRLQLLEPEKHPSLNKCLYGLLMLLPQTTAFHTLRNRLSSIAPLGLAHTSSKLVTAINRSKSNEPNWSELLSRFRSVQGKRSSATYRRAILEREKLT